MNSKLKDLILFINQIPWVECIWEDINDEWKWYCKIIIDTKSDLSWNVVQELWHILNYLSIDEKLPTVFYPVSPPPYLNGWPDEFLSWIIENTNSDFSPKLCLDWLKWRLPQPINDLEKWKI